ncbi:phage tail protein [Furfurilactobacillus entadae]|uniref:phage tail protein n=1 Tax=Furfurilactobacillus entadae TaxID=2922307 RepID=UPI0035EE1D11
MNTKDKIVIQDSKRLYTEILANVDFDSFEKTWQKNSELQLDFTAYDDSSIAFDLLEVESSVWYDSQEYITKQVTDDFKDGQRIKTVTATHVFYQLNYRRQRNKKDGAQSYSINSALDFLLDGINTGFSYQIHGDFGDQTLTDFGNCSLSDGLSTIMENFHVYAYYPDNYVINIYDEKNFTQDTDNVFRYRNNTEEVQMQYDSTTIVNTVMASSSVTRDVTNTTTTGGNGQDKIEAMINWGEQQKGASYSMAARTGPNSFDCSGFVWSCMKAAGFSVLNYAWATPYMDSDVTGAHTYLDQVDLNDAQRGDVVVTGGASGGGANGHTFILLEKFHGDDTKVLQCSYPVGVNDTGTYKYASVDGQVVVGRPKGVTESSTESETTQVPVFDPFIVVNDDSVTRWGERDGDDVSSDSIDNPDAMKAYALSQMQSEPSSTITLTLASSEVPNPGDKWTLQVLAADYQTTVETVAIQSFPFSRKPAQITLNNLRRNFFDSLSANQRQITSIKDGLVKIKDSTNEALYTNAMITDQDTIQALQEMGGGS